MGSSSNAQIDLEALREKYRLERERRLRPEGQDQYIITSGAFASFADEDPFVAERDGREALYDTVKILIVGAGFGGLMAATKLKEVGLDEMRIIEAGGDFGGTWYWNRYPGAQCDLESYVYLPLLEEMGYIPKERYSYAPEIFQYIQQIARRYGLYRHAVFQTRVERIEWDDDTKFWKVSTNRGDFFRAQFVLCAPGFASRPKLPGIPGIETFKGKSFHTARWDYSYTGGDYSGNLTKLADKRVGIIGTGATAIQVVPFLGEYSKHLYVFQRTPSSVDIRNNAPTDPEWARRLKPGWQRERQDNFDLLISGKLVEEDMIKDGWTVIYRKLTKMLAEDPDADPEYLRELADAEHMEDLRGRISECVKDPKTAEALKPWYRYPCKRPTFNDDYLLTFNRPNVTLVDTSPSLGVEEIKPHSLIANGKEYEIDCLIFATGFEFNTTQERRIGFDIVGRGGQSLFSHWADGMRTLHGHSAHGFPNWFLIGLTQSPGTINYMGTCTKQTEHIAYIIKTIGKLGYVAAEPSKEAEEDWVQEVRHQAKISREFLNSCTPGYHNNEGNPNSVGIAGSVYQGDIELFDAMIERWQAKGTLEGMTLSGEQSQ